MAPSDISLRPIAHIPTRTSAHRHSRSVAADNTCRRRSQYDGAQFHRGVRTDRRGGSGSGHHRRQHGPGPGAAAAPAAAPGRRPRRDTDGPAGPLFGANPWLTDPTGSGPGPVTHYNPIYFATPQTAQTVAQMVGGTVISMQYSPPRPEARSNRMSPT